MDRLLALLPLAQIEMLLADREFIGKDWFAYLQEKQLPGRPPFPVLLTLCDSST